MSFIKYIGMVVLALSHLLVFCTQFRHRFLDKRRLPHRRGEMSITLI